MVLTANTFTEKLHVMFTHYYIITVKFIVFISRFSGDKIARLPCLCIYHKR